MRISTLIAAVAGLITGALALLAAPCALALSLGDAAPQSSLGQPLRVVVPIDASKAQSLDRRMRPRHRRRGGRQRSAAATDGQSHY